MVPIVKTTAFLLMSSPVFIAPSAREQRIGTEPLSLRTQEIELQAAPAAAKALPAPERAVAAIIPLGGAPRTAAAAAKALPVPERAVDVVVALGGALTNEKNTRAVLAAAFDHSARPQTPAPEAIPSSPEEPYKNRWAQLRRGWRDVDSITAYPTERTAPIPALVKIVSDPQEGLLAKLLMIRRARRTIDVGTYILKRDASAYAVIQELTVALERGVSVRMMIDSLGSFAFLRPYHPELKALLNAKRGFIPDETGRPTAERASVEIVSFNSVLNLKLRFEMLRRWAWNLLHSKKEDLGHLYRWRNRRSHDKALIIDAEDHEQAMAIVGGRNIADHYYGLPELAPNTFNDMEIIVRHDPAVAGSATLSNTLGEHYDRLFFHLGNRLFTPNRRAGADIRERRAIRKGHSRIFSNPEAAAKFEAMLANHWLEEGFAPAKASFLNEIDNLSRRNAFTNPDAEKNPDNKPNGNSILLRVSEALQYAKKSIVFVSPYFYLEKNEIAWINQWLAADPQRRMTIISNSIATTDNLPAQALVDTHLAEGFYPKESSRVPDGPRQSRIYAFGRLDSQEYGGPAFYGKLHAKYVIIDGKMIVITTSNGDPRSRRLNSELGFLADGPASERLAREAEILMGKSYEWGSADWAAVRGKHKIKTFISVLLGKLLRYSFFAKRMI